MGVRLRRRGRRRSWPPSGGPYRDERLAFIAAAPELRRRANRGRLIWSFVTLVLDQDVLDERGIGSGRVIACDEAARKLDAFERQRLREHGELPDWFIGEVERLAQRR